MSNIQQVFIDRDGMEIDEAAQRFQGLKEQAEQLIDEGGTLEDIETLLREEAGLEPDYIMELVD